MPTEEELKQFGAKPPEEPAPPPEARTHQPCVEPWEMILGSPASPKLPHFCVFLEDMRIECHISGLVALSF